jgi:DNA-binding NarL/FixJ family response regulator
VTEAGASAARPKTIRVGVIEDRSDIREALELLLDETDGLACVGAWGSMEAALPRIAPPLPDVVLVDIGLPGMSGVEGIRLLRERHPSLILLVLSIYEEDQRIFDALCAGATGYLVKNTSPESLIASLHEAVAGGSPMSPQIARKVIELFRQLAPTSPPDYNLTPHETRLLRLMAEGLHYKTAGERLGVTASTVSFHLQQIYRKLQVQTKSEAVAKALREHLID